MVSKGIIMSNARNLANLLETDGDVITAALDNIVQTPSAISDQANTSTGALGLPTGTTAQRPVSPNSGYTRYNTTSGSLEFYDGTAWIATNLIPSITSITGNINNAYGTTLTFAVINSTDLVNVIYKEGGTTIATTSDVTVSSGSFTTVVPAAVYGQTVGDTISISINNSDGTPSQNSIAKTVVVAPTGGTITTDGTARIHTFLSSGTFTNTADVTSVRYLMVAGGGGGAPIGGGGGAGGYLAGTSMSVSNQAYSIVVGAGGNGGAPGVAGGTGGNTTFNSLTAIGGGGGGCHQSGATSVAGTNGGSGGGGSDNSNSYGPGSGTSGQGNAGGTGSGVYNQNGEADRTGGGGGGAGAVGGSGKPAHGGVGLQNNINGTNHYWAGGGGGAPYGSSTSFNGGNGGNGGGGGASAGAGGNTGSGGTGGSGLNTGATGVTINAGAAGGIGGANTGGGGGGSNWSHSGSSVKSGGDGIVIIRYEM